MARMDEKRREMILKGDLLKTIIIICMPLALYQFFNSCYNLLDQIICAQISVTAQNAVSSIGQIKSAFSSFGAGLAAGGGVLVSRYYGAGEVNKARHASSNLFFMSIVLSVILMVILIPLGGWAKSEKQEQPALNILCLALQQRSFSVCATIWNMLKGMIL